MCRTFIANRSRERRELEITQWINNIGFMLAKESCRIACISVAISNIKEIILMPAKPLHEHQVKCLDFGSGVTAAQFKDFSRHDRNVKSFLVKFLLILVLGEKMPIDYCIKFLQTEDSCDPSRYQCINWFLSASNTHFCLFHRKDEIELLA